MMTSLWMLSALTSASLRASEPSVRVYREFPVIRYVAPAVPPPKKIKQESLGMEVTARSAIVMDVASGVILFEKQASAQRPLASITKLMTALVALEELHGTNPEWTVRAEDVNLDGKDPLITNATYQAHDILEAMLVGSINTGGNTVARELGGMSAFVAKMNARANALGLAETHFVDPMGLSPENVSSAYDVAKLLNTVLAQEQIRAWTGEKSVNIAPIGSSNTIVIQNTNSLLGTFLNKGSFQIVGAKTGSLPEAGYCLAQRTKKVGGTGEVLTVVMGSESNSARFQDVKTLTSWAFRVHEWPALIGMRKNIDQTAKIK